MPRIRPAGAGVVTPRELSRILRRIRAEGALAISDIKDDTLVDKAHLWSSKKPSKRALEAGFYSGRLVISKRRGMLKTYELTERHFGFEKLPKPAGKREIDRYHLERALRGHRGSSASIRSVSTLPMPNRQSTSRPSPN